MLVVLVVLGLIVLALTMICHIIVIVASNYLLVDFVLALNSHRAVVGFHGAAWTKGSQKIKFAPLKVHSAFPCNEGEKQHSKTTETRIVVLPIEYRIEYYYGNVSKKDERVDFCHCSKALL
jgi:hypothetical protein